MGALLTLVDITICAGIVSPASVQVVNLIINAAPDDHFTAAPHCPVTLSANRRVCCAGGLPIIRDWIISAAGIQKDLKIENAAPGQLFHCRSTPRGGNFFVRAPTP